MFEDLTRITRQDLKDKITELAEILKDTRDYINNQQNEIDVLKHHFSDSFRDAKRFSKILKEAYEVIKDKNLQDDFENTGLADLIDE